MAEFGEKKFKKELIEKKLYKGEKKELTPKERYVLGSIPAGRNLKLVLESLEEHPDYSLYQIAREIERKSGKSIKFILRGLTILEKRGILTKETKEGEVKIKRVNLEKLEELWEETKADEIMKLVEENKFITIKQIAEILNEPYDSINREVKKLNSLGLVKEMKLPIVRHSKYVVFSASFSEKITTKEVNERIRKIDAEIKRTKEAKEK